MIVGIGTDLCRVSRVKHSLDRFGDTFARTYCNPREIEYAKRQLNPAMAFSQCLATKEALHTLVARSLTRLPLILSSWAE